MVTDTFPRYWSTRGKEGKKKEKKGELRATSLKIISFLISSRRKKGKEERKNKSKLTFTKCSECLKEKRKKKKGKKEGKSTAQCG